MTLVVGKRHADGRRVERLNVERTFRATNHQVSPAKPSTSMALDLTVAVARGYSNTASMLSSSAVVNWRGMSGIRSDLLWTCPEPQSPDR